MPNKTLADFHRELSWQTRIYTLLTVATIVAAFLFDAWNSNWVMTILVVLAVILFVESFAMRFQHTQSLWKGIRVILWLVGLIAIALALIGLISN
jgi:cytochrome c oxidase assembly factor CtaG